MKMQTAWNVFTGVAIRIEALASENQELRKRNEALNLQLLNIFEKQESAFSEINQENGKLQKLYEEQQTQILGVNALLKQEKIGKENLLKLTGNQRQKNEEEMNLLREQTLSAHRKCLYDEELLDNLKSEMSVMKVEKGDLMIQFQKLNSSFIKLEPVLEENKKTCDDLIESIEQVAKCNKALQAQVGQKNKVIESAQKELLEKEDRILHLSEEIRRLKEGHEKFLMEQCMEESWKLAEIEGLRREIHRLTEKVAVADSENACLKNQLFRAFEQLKLAENQLRNQSSESIDEKPVATEGNKNTESKSNKLPEQTSQILP